MSSDALPTTFGLLLCRQTKRSISFLFPNQQQFRLTERRLTIE